MADKILATRIKLKYDLYSKWVTNNPVLLEGEVAFAYVPTDSSLNVGQTVQGSTPPQVLIKVGDGVNHYNDLKYVSALAADVLAACKSEASLKTFINNVIADAGIATNEALTALSGRVTTVEGGIATLKGDSSVEGSVAKAIADAIAALSLADTYAEKSHTHVASEITDFDTTIKAYNYATKAEAQDYANAKDEAIAAAKKAGDDAQADVDALGAKVGAVTENKTLVEMITDAQTAATYDDTELSGRVEAVEGSVTTLVGEDANKSARAIASEEVAKIVANADESFDTLKEIADWISTHKTDATAMNSAITALEGIVDGIGGEGEKATVVAYVTDAIAALKIGDYAKAADLTALAGRIQTLERDTHTHSNKAVLDSITNSKVASWDGAEQNAKGYADGIVATAKTEISAEIDADVKAVNDALGEYKTSNNAEVAKKANNADLKPVAKSGLIDDLSIGAGTVLIFDCGGAE